MYEISRDLLSKYKFEKVEYRDITKCGVEKVSLDVFVPLKITFVDEWVANVDELNKLLNENENLVRMIWIQFIENTMKNFLKKISY